MGKFSHDIVVEGRLQNPEIEAHVLELNQKVRGLMATATAEGLRLRFSTAHQIDDVRALLSGFGFNFLPRYDLSKAVPDGLQVDEGKLNAVTCDLYDILDTFASAPVVLGVWREFFEVAIPAAMKALLSSFETFPPSMRGEDFMQMVIDEMFFLCRNLEESFNADPVIRKVFEEIFAKNLAIVFP